MGPRIVIAAYRPKEGQAAALVDLLQAHVPLLQDEGLASDREPVLMRAADGTILEIFEWAYDGADAEAHDNEAVMQLWELVARLSDTVAPGEVAELAKPFPHFKPI